MNITITARKTTAKESFKQRVEKKLAKLDRFFEDDARVHVVVTNENERETVEVTVLASGMFFRAEKTTADRLDSLEAAVDSIYRQIVKNKKKLETRIKKADPTAFGTQDEADDVQGEEEYRIVRRKEFALKPMTVEEAILQMNLLNHQFFVFLNSDTSAVSIVYRRQNGYYGLLEPNY